MAKFKVIHEFRHDCGGAVGHMIFEEGNSHDSAKLNISDGQLAVFHRQGWVSLDGKDDMSLDPQRTEVMPDNVTHAVPPASASQEG